MKAMIFAAGLGTRLKPFTETYPKALFPVGGIPLLEHRIIKLKASGYTDVIINVHHFADKIIQFLESKNYFDINIVISDEREKLLDTGGAIKKSKFFLDGNDPFLIHNVDILSNIELEKLHQSHSSSDLATLVVSERETSRYLLFDDNNQLKGWTNINSGEIKPKGLTDITRLRKLAFSGIQIISPKVFKLMENTEDKFSIIDFYMNNVQNNSIKSFIPEDFKMLDVGKTEIIEEAEKFISEL